MKKIVCLILILVLYKSCIFFASEKILQNVLDAKVTCIANRQSFFKLDNYCDTITIESKNIFKILLKKVRWGLRLSLDRGLHVFVAIDDSSADLSAVVAKHSLDAFSYIDLNIDHGQLTYNSNKYSFYCKNNIFYIGDAISLHLKPSDTILKAHNVNIADFVPCSQGVFTGYFIFDDSLELTFARVTTADALLGSIKTSFDLILNDAICKANIIADYANYHLKGVAHITKDLFRCSLKDKKAAITCSYANKKCVADIKLGDSRAYAVGYKNNDAIFVDLNYSQFDITCLQDLSAIFYPHIKKIVTKGQLSGALSLQMVAGKFTNCSSDRLLVSDFMLQKDGQTLLSPSFCIDKLNIGNVVDLSLNCDNFILQKDATKTFISTKLQLLHSNWVDSNITFFGNHFQTNMKLTNSVNNTVAIADFKGFVPSAFVPRRYKQYVEALAKLPCKGRFMVQLNYCDILVNSSFLIDDNFELTLLAEYKLLQPSCKSLHLFTKNLNLKKIETAFGEFSGDFDITVHYADDNVYTEFIGNHVTFSNKVFCSTIPLQNSFLRFLYNMKNDEWNLKGATHGATLVLPKYNVKFTNIDYDMDCGKKFSFFNAHKCKYLDIELSGALSCHAKQDSYDVRLMLNKADGSIIALRNLLKNCNIVTLPVLDGSIRLVKNMQIVTDGCGQFSYDGEFAVSNLQYSHDSFNVLKGEGFLKIKSGVIDLYNFRSDVRFLQKDLNLIIPYCHLEPKNINFDLRLTNGLYDLVRLAGTTFMHEKKAWLSFDPVTTFFGNQIHIAPIAIDEKMAVKAELFCDMQYGSLLRTFFDISDFSATLNCTATLTPQEYILKCTLSDLNYGGKSFKNSNFSFYWSPVECYLHQDLFGDIFSDLFGDFKIYFEKSPDICAIRIDDPRIQLRSNLSFLKKYHLNISAFKIYDKFAGKADIAFDNYFHNLELDLRLNVDKAEYSGVTLSTLAPLNIRYSHNIFTIHDINCNIFFCNTSGAISAKKAFFKNSTFYVDDMDIVVQSKKLDRQKIRAKLHYNFDAHTAAAQLHHVSLLGYDISDILLSYSHDTLCYSMDIAKNGIPLSLRGTSRKNLSLGLCKAVTKDEVMTFSWDDFSLQDIWGHCHGLDVTFFKERGKSCINVNCDFKRIKKMLSGSLLDKINKFQLGSGYSLKGFWADNTFTGSLYGSEYELLGYTFNKFFVAILYKDKKLFFEDFLLSDEALIFQLPKALFDFDTLRVDIPCVTLRSFRPSLLTPINGTKEELDPFLIPLLHIDDISGNIFDPRSFTGKGFFKFINSFKRDYTILDIPADLIGGIFGLDMELLIPVKGLFKFSIKDGFAKMVSLKNAFSENNRSQFFLTQDLSFIDWNAKINIDMAMKQFVIFKFTENLLLSIRGSLLKPKIALRRKPAT